MEFSNKIPEAPSFEGSGIGTYYTESKTFVDPSGWGYSMREAPKGAKIVKKYDPNLMLSNLKEEVGSAPKFSESILFRGINLPEVKEKKVRESYDPRSGMYVSSSPTGYGATAYTRPPTPKERKAIEEAQYKGSYEYISEKAEEKVVTPVLNFFEPVTKKVRDVPLETSGGKIIYTDEFGKEKIFEQPKEVTTLGQTILGLKEETERLMEKSREGWGDISTRFFESAEKKKKGIKKNILFSAGQISSFLGETTRVTPSIVQYSLLTSMGGASIDILAAEQKKEDIDKYISKELEEQYKLYEKQYKEAEKEVKEGYELEQKLSKKEFEEKYGKEIIESVERTIRQEAVIPFFILGTSGAVKLGKALTTPKLVEGSIKGGKVIKLESKQEFQKLFIDKRVKDFAKFKQMYIKTPTTGYYQSPLGKLFGKEGKLKVLSKGQTYVYEPVKNIFGVPIETGKPYLARFGRVGKGGNIVNQRFYLVRDSAKQIPKEGLGTLSKGQKYLFGELIEKTKTGIPVRKVDLSKYFGGKESLQVGRTTGIKISKIGTGRATTLGQTGTITKKIGRLPTGETTFRFQTGVKDITKPFSRATGKIDLQSGIIIRHPTKFIEYKKIKGFTGGGKKSSQNFLQKMYQSPKPITVPKINIPKISKVEANLEPTKVISKIETPIVSVYAGTGLYERTGGFNFGIPKVKIQEPILIGDFFGQSLNYKLKTSPFLRVLPRLKENLKIEPQISFRELQQPKIISKELTKLKNKQILKQEQTKKQITSSEIGYKMIKSPKIPKPIQTKIKFPKLFGKKKGEKILKIGEDEFEVFIRKKGKDIGIGEFPTFEKAQEALKGKLKTTIRASGFIKKGEEKIMPDLRKFGKEFRIGKKEPFRIVQKKEKRLGTLPETKEIQFFRKKKGGLF